uniref:RRM domain-containing protein n=1 Tax=Acrobeloides nanus TaxID=290746 RepID=A0A914DBN3_9BILA
MKGLLISITISFIFCYINAESAGQFNDLIKGGPSNDAFCATSQCAVGFQIVNTTSNSVTNAAFFLNLPKDSSCLSANFVTGGSNITLFAAEAYGLCNSTALNATGLSYGVQYSCCNCPSVNCNAAPYNITPITSTSPNPTACYEGIWVNGTVALKDNEFGPSVCYGKCSRLSTNLNGTTVDLFTCSPENLCRALNFTDANPCGTAGQVSGCCCTEFEKMPRKYYAMVSKKRKMINRRRDSKGRLLAKDAEKTKQDKQAKGRVNAKPNKILCVTNLPEETTQEMLRHIFNPRPGLTDIRLVSGRSDIAFVEFVGEAEATAAKKALNNFKITPNQAMQLEYAAK